VIRREADHADSMGHRELTPMAERDQAQTASPFGRQ
jgi:hypothetical protein